MESVSNLYVSESVATADTILTLPWRARYIEIINDSATSTLGYKFSEGESFATLNPLEAVNPHVKSKYIYLNGDDVYRIRAEG